MDISGVALAVVVERMPPGSAFTPDRPLGGVKAVYAEVGPRTPAGVVWFGVFIGCSAINLPKQVPNVGPPLFFVLFTVSGKLGMVRIWGCTGGAIEAVCGADPRRCLVYSKLRRLL